MLGAVKGDVPAEGSVFRRLARRWRPVARVKRRCVSFSAALGLDGEDRDVPSRAWIGAPHAPAVLTPVDETKPAPKRSRVLWSPWLWVK